MLGQFFATLPSPRSTRGNGLIVLQNGAPAHKTADVRAFIQGRLPLFQLSPQRPDLNIIEYIWAQLKQTIKWKKRTRPELLREIDIFWKDLSADRINSLVRTMPEHCMAVLKANGGPTKY